MGRPWESPPAKPTSSKGCASCGGGGGLGLLELELGPSIPNQLSIAEQQELGALQGVLDGAAKKVRRIDNGVVNNLVGAVHGMIGHGVLGIVKDEDLLLGCNDQAGAAAAALKADPRFAGWEIKQVTREGVGPLNTGYHHKVYAKSPHTGREYSVDMHAGREVRPWSESDASFK